MEPQILFEDDALLIINKPAGFTVNRADTTKGEETVQDWVETYLKVSKGSEVPHVLKGEVEQLDGEGEYAFEDPAVTFANRNGIAHRLDKETSGVLVIAKTLPAFIELQRQFKERIVKKTYVALSHGAIQPEEGEIRVPVGRLPWNRKQFGVVAGGRESITKYKVLFTMKSPVAKEILSFVELYPETGRTHQIRVHLKYINHPIFSDFLYAGRKTSRTDRTVLARVFLHAAKLSLIHPTTREQMSFEAPLPHELHNVIKEVSKD